MFNTIAGVRGLILAVVFLGFLSSLVIGAEFDLVAASGPSDNRTQRLELEELLTLSGIFSLLLAALACFGGRFALSERRTRSTVERVAYLDPLTSLPNRRLFDERLSEALADRRAGIACAVLLIDLDHFKKVNDTLGHAAGDALLGEVGRRIRSVAPAINDCARLGGDEFALILRGNDAHEFTARGIALQLWEQIGRVVEFRGEVLKPSASIGIAFATDGSTRSSELLEAADQDMYRNKRSARSRIAA